MNHIDEKFKENHPSKTVEKIRRILADLGVNIEETWNDSGMENCWSLTLRANGRKPHSNGKGITKELAQASAYGEFIERLQSGLFLYKFQSIHSDRDMDLQSYASDARYMTLEELEENGEWMDAIIAAYGCGLTRKKLAQQCQMYACTDGKILTVPFYSLFEDKYVYLPTGFIEQIYSANGCCVGNSRDEAWVHALAEIMERKGSIALMTGSITPVRIPDEVLAQFPTVTKILDRIKAEGKYQVDVFDTSIGNGHPVITTRIINKDTHAYVVNTGSDPVFEIAVHRTLTEIFQGRNIENITNFNNSMLLKSTDQFPLTHNIMNLLETGNGNFTYDFFLEELSPDQEFAGFADNSNKSNAELLQIMLKLFRDENLQVYVRNYSYLGFPCYKFIVPGFSESRGFRLTEPYQEYLVADNTAKVLRNPLSANPAQLQLFLDYCKQINTVWSRRNSFGFLSGIPVKLPWMIKLTQAYATYTLGKFKDTIKYLDSINFSKAGDPEQGQYFACLSKYLQMKVDGKKPHEIRILLYKFFRNEYANALFSRLDNGQNPFEGYLMKCNPNDCTDCKFKERCFYHDIKAVNMAAGKIYHEFTQGQARENFMI